MALDRALTANRSSPFRGIRGDLLTPPSLSSKNFITYPALRPLAWIFGRIMRERNRRFDTGRIPVQSVAVPVISVGNLSVGGTGKTPMCRWLLKVLKEQGLHPAMLSRGYGRKTSGFLALHAGSTADEVGDDIRHILAVLRRRAYPQVKESNLMLTVPLIQTLLLLTMESQSTGNVKVRSLSRQEQLSKDFFVLLLRRHREEHDVSYYAEQMFVTPKYLSTVVRKTTGSSVQDWVGRLLLFAAKSLLKNSRLSVQQIADELHFSTPSSFIRFFHRQTGLTPRQYRIKK